MFIFPLQYIFLILYFLFLEPRAKTEEVTEFTDLEVQTAPATPDVMVPTIDVPEGAKPEGAGSGASNQTLDPLLGLDLDSVNGASPRSLLPELLLNMVDQSYLRG